MTTQLNSVPAPMSVKQLAARWGCSKGVVHKLIKDGLLQCFRLGTLIRIPIAEITRYECQTITNHTQSSDFGTATLSYGGSPTMDNASAGVDNCKRAIGRAQRRKLASSGKMATVHHGPWAGS